MRSNGTRAQGRAGVIVLGIAALHSLLGILSGARLVPDPEMQRLVGPRAPLMELRLFMGLQAPPDLVVMTLFWYLFFGLLLGMYGWLIRHYEAHQTEVPTFVAFHLGGLGLAGGFLLPASGFWLALIPAYLIVRQNRRRPLQT